MESDASNLIFIHIPHQTKKHCHGQDLSGFPVPASKKPRHKATTPYKHDFDISTDGSCPP